MSRFRILIQRIDDEGETERVTDLDQIDVLAADARCLQKETALDQLEAQTLATGQEVMRHLLQRQWERVDQQLVDNYRELFPLSQIKGDGHDPIKVASRIGLLHLPRQVLEDARGAHLVPGNELLPEHGGMIITRCLREWTCLLSLDVSGQTTQRLLGVVTQEPQILSASEVRALVRQHGAEIRAAEAAEVDHLLAHPSLLAGVRPQLVTVETIRRKAAWPKELTAAVEAALAQEQPQPPAGVSPADWERVLEARRAEQEADAAEALRRLGPAIAADQIVVGTDEVLVRAPQKGEFRELRTARVETAGGYRYVSGRKGASFLSLLWVLLLLCGAQTALVTLVSDGAQWIRDFVRARLSALPRWEFVLDWLHLAKRCRELTSRIGTDRAARRSLCKRVLSWLWQGEVARALEVLEAYRPQTKHEERLDELMGYLKNREESLVNYRARRRQRGYIGSGGVEKANDVIVARRMKRRGMHWSEESADALAALKTLWLNHGWDLYWERREVLRLAAA
jgi:Uncharacterised protein family (UPF0236)